VTHRTEKEAESLTAKELVFLETANQELCTQLRHWQREWSLVMLEKAKLASVAEAAAEIYSMYKNEDEGQHYTYEVWAEARADLGKALASLETFVRGE
jgi:hypothetical protein